MNSWGFFAIFFVFVLVLVFYLFPLSFGLKAELLKLCQGDVWWFLHLRAFEETLEKLLKIEVGGTEGARFVTRDVGRLWRVFLGLFMNRFGAAFGALVITLGGSYRALVMLWNLELNQGNGCCKDFGVGWTVDFASSFGIRLSFKEDLSPAAMRWPFLSWILSSFVA